MDTVIYATKTYQDEAKKTAQKEEELLRLLNVKTEKLANDFLTKNQHTQLSYLTKEQQVGATAIPKGLIIDKLLHYLHSL